MCKELYQRWYGCDCWGFLRCDPCPRLFKGCLGPGGVEDKRVVEWNNGMCNECWERLLIEAREEAEAASANASSSSSSNQKRSRVDDDDDDDRNHTTHRNNNNNNYTNTTTAARAATKRSRQEAPPPSEEAEDLAAASVSSASVRSWSRSESVSTPTSSGIEFW